MKQKSGSIHDVMTSHIRHTARGIVIQDGKILVFERWRRATDGTPLHYFSIPGGGIERHESPEHALVREMQEEMTVKVEIDRLLVRQTTPDRFHYYFLCHIIEGVPSFNPQSEEALSSRYLATHYRVRWLPVSTAVQQLRHPEHSQALIEILKMYKNEQTLPIDIVFEKSYTS